MTLLEICVDDAKGLAAAIAGGADRVELCSVLELGGLTPMPGLLALAARAPVPVRAMIRPRAGDFVFDADDVDAMLGDIDAARRAGLGGVVLGASLPDGRLDIETLERLTDEAGEMDKTLHRAVDLVPDLAEAVEQAVALGFDTILTSGRARTAPEGLADLALMHQLADGRLTIMAGSGINATTVGNILDVAPLEFVHGACGEPAAPDSAPAAQLGFASPARRNTSQAQVAALKAALLAR
ncbi:copper homeostasis protein CutC [Devosia sp. XJ19-1]|uniref:PF03932 family protein CutC n=1 Tax=Devosia ureilytica TaxID=2952754 RepID=A0A9Q4AR13_9HYPH|nr:copper homeostasis protein CutC [Devosia ureilytica]MCP8885131.1 copper homeostasis protein CutC [Devosia ureilytica]MCP8888853.1 copper homeostasis protein CutC [Devosia ureilytica]